MKLFTLPRRDIENDYDNDVLRQFAIVEPPITFHTSSESAAYYELTGGTPNLPVVSPKLMAVIESLATKGIRPTDLTPEFIDYAKALAVIH